MTRRRFEAWARAFKVERRTVRPQRFLCYMSRKLKYTTYKAFRPVALANQIVPTCLLVEMTRAYKMIVCNNTNH